MKYFSLFVVLVVVIAACQPQETETPVLPTLVEFPSETPTETATEPPTALPTRTSTATPTATYTSSATLRPSLTPSNTPTATRTPDTARAQAASATAAIIEAPVFSTFTPASADARPTRIGTPQVIADVIITEAQFQEEVTLKIADMPNVDRAVVDLTPEGIVVTLTVTSDDGALTTGDLIIFVTSQDGLAVIQGALALDEDDLEPSESFLNFATGDFFLEMVDVIDLILDQRLGETHNLESVRLTDEAMLIRLLVPLPITR